MMSKFYDYVDEIIDIEGGYSDDPDDSGGKTKYGITEERAREFGYDGKMENLTEDLAKKIYKEDYWNVNHLDKVAEIHPPLSYEMFDTGVNAGIKKACIFLQRSLNVFNNRETQYDNIPVDGWMGPKTITALRAFDNRRGEEGLEVLTVVLDCLQGAFYVKLCEEREKDEKFMYGWAKNRLRHG